MNHQLLQHHLAIYRKKLAHEDQKTKDERIERAERVAYYEGWTAERLRSMTPEDLYQYIAKLWAMLIWGNKQYVVDRLIADNGLDVLRTELVALVWGNRKRGRRELSRNNSLRPLVCLIPAVP